MSHLELASSKKRLSSDTVYLEEDKILNISVYGWTQELSIRSTNEGAIKVKTPLTSDGKCTLIGGTEKEARTAQQPRIELVYKGEHVWDYFEVAIFKGKMPEGYAKISNYVHPENKTVNLTVFSTQDASNFHLQRSADIARLMLERHGLKLSVMPDNKISDPHILAHNDSLVAEQDLTKLLKLISKSGANFTDRLVVINANIDQKFFYGKDGDKLYGLAYKASQSPWEKDFILFNAARSSPTGVTLLHEIGHCAGLDHNFDNASTLASNFMNEFEKDKYKPAGTSMLLIQVKSIAKAFFSH
jgi:hypothetical protein